MFSLESSTSSTYTHPLSCLFCGVPGTTNRDTRRVKLFFFIFYVAISISGVTFVSAALHLLISNLGVLSQVA